MGVARPRVVNRRRERYTVYIGRPGPYGNPFRIGPDGTRAEVIAKYRRHAEREIAAGRLDLAPLTGAVLGCWCAPAACHGDVLADLVVAAGG